MNLTIISTSFRSTDPLLPCSGCKRRRLMQPPGPPFAPEQDHNNESGQGRRKVLVTKSLCTWQEKHRREYEFDNHFNSVSIHRSFAPLFRIMQTKASDQSPGPPFAPEQEESGQGRRKVLVTKSLCTWQDKHRREYEFDNHFNIVSIHRSFAPLFRICKRRRLISPLDLRLLPNRIITMNRARGDGKS